MNGDSDILVGYRLERLLGRGTMGSVYLARRTGGAQPAGPGEKANGGRAKESKANESSANDNRPVAIKRVPSLGSDDDRERLLREAQTMVSLRHPNILSVLDVVDDGDGIAVVLPFAAHGTLASRLAESGPIEPTTLRALLAPVAEALDFAHRNGVLHRDVKPSNIVFVDRDTALLADFGIARNAAHTNLTRTNLAIGTAGYLDPELADGGEPSPASDQYALGIVCYEALTGAVPYTGHAPLAVIRAADRGEHAPLDPAAFGSLGAVVERAIDRDPTKRFATCAAFAGALRAGADLTIPADATAAFQRRIAPQTLAAAAPVASRNRRPLWAAFGVAAVALAIGGSFALRGASPAGPIPLRVRALPTCDPQLTAQCVRSYSQTGAGLKVSFESGESATYAIGQPGDVLRVANFFCGTRATLAVYRPSTGAVYYLSDWPELGAEPLEVIADPTGVRDAQVAVGDQNSDGCADVALDRSGARTWFLPHVQTGRLQKVPVTSLTTNGPAS